MRIRNPKVKAPRGILRRLLLGLLLGLLLLTGALTGCNLPYRAMPLDESPAHARPFHQERDGFVMSADLLSGQCETAAHLYFDLQERGIYPVVIHIENNGDRTAILRRESMLLRLEGAADALLPLDPDDVVAEVRTSPAAALIGLPLIVPYLVGRQEIAEFNFELESDYRGKSFPSYLRLAPGDANCARVIFFRIPEELSDRLQRTPVLEVQAEVEAVRNAGAATGSDTKAGKNVRFLLSLG